MYLAKPNTLGNQVAENDFLQLEQNFVETPEFRSILETRERSAVVGRRGTGKSAMAWKLAKIWAGQKSNQVIRIEPEDYQTIAFRALFSDFHQKFNFTRAAAKIAWKYLLLMEIVSALNRGYKTKTYIQSRAILCDHIKKWSSDGQPVLTKATIRLGDFFRGGVPEEKLGMLPSKLQLADLEREVSEVLENSNCRFFILIDRLDEGFENDEVGAAIVSAAIGVVSEFNQRFQFVRAVVFVRDNVNKAMEIHDPDYSRNVEGEVIRLHWNQQQLLRVVARRMDSVFSFGLENDQKVWDRAVADEGGGKELKGREGFRKCLQFTLYRPRDLLSLLNQAYFAAGRSGRETLVFSDIEQTAKSISDIRLEDLKKEYVSVLPCIKKVVDQFKQRSPNLSYEDAIVLLRDLCDESVWGGDPKGFQDFRILGEAGAIKALHGIGFIGNFDAGSSTFNFYHDGRSPEEELVGSKRLLIHPCYWMALSLSKNALTVDQAEQINDEYEIKVSSQTPEIRAARIGSLISSLNSIPEGIDGARSFEDWVCNAIQTVFAGHVSNVQTKPNGSAVQRRDVVATNMDRTPAFSRILRDYQVRQVVFEVKNYREIGGDEFRQMNSYLTNCYGRLGFIVNRSVDDNLNADRELAWVREIYNAHKKLIVVLNAKFLSKLLSKLRSPEKHDAVDKAVQSLLDQYERSYLGTQSGGRSKRSKS